MAVPASRSRWKRDTGTMAALLSGTLRLSARGPLPLDDVWERYTRTSYWPQWAPHMREVDYPEGVVTPATTGRVTAVGGVVADFRIDAVDETSHTWAWSVRCGPLHVSFEHGVHAAVDGAPPGSVAWLVMRGAWPVVLGYAPLARYSLSRLVRPV